MSCHSRKAMIIRIQPTELQSETMYKFIISFVALLFLTSHVISDECSKCVPKEKCKEFGTLNADEQKVWEKKYPCKVPDYEEHGKTGLTAFAAGDHVCCPSAVVGFNNNQCTMPSLPPGPETGCCGREASKTNNIESETPPREDRLRHWGSLFRRWRRSVEEDNANVTIEGYISNGKDTDLEQFPWAVHLRMTFNDGYEQSGTTCGGSLISSQHVVTAAHCVYKPGAELTEVQVYLAEYDKRTSRDCKIVPGHGTKCVTNMVMKAKRVFIHPEYENNYLNNDIALLRLDGHAPYTNYIRPICLPSANVDNSEFSNLRLAVTGWGDDGPYRFYGSVIKQFTILNLVPHNTCRHTYPYLFPGQMCARGNSGEDICAGDSGGPLMIMHNGQYQLVGVVSGKRQDSRCGSNVPSLFTNVHYHLDWIYRNIRN